MSGVLRRPGVGRLVAAGLASEVGDWLLLIALPLFVLDLTGSAFVTATVFVLELLPMVVLGPLAGVLVDRFDRWRLITVVAVVQALVLLPLLLVRSSDQLWLVYVVVVVQAVLGTVIEPARQAAASALVPAEDRLALNTALGIGSSLARLVGGPLGGLVYGLGGIEAVVVADAVTFLLAAALLAVRRRRARPTGAPPGPAAASVLSDLRVGLRAVASSRVLRRVLVVAGLMGIAQGAFLVLFVLFVTRDLSGSPQDVGLLRGVQAVGALVGGGLLGLVARRVGAATLAGTSLVAFGVLSLITWNAPLVSTDLWLFVVLFVLVGLPAITGTTALMTLIADHTEDAVRGRVLSAFFALYGAAQAAGMLLAGSAGTGSGLTVALEVQAGLYLLAGVLALPLRRHDARPAPPMIAAPARRQNQENRGDPADPVVR